MDINEAIQSAIENLQSGNLIEAGNICIEILKLQTNDVYILSLIGGIYFQIGYAYQEKGRLDEAISFYQKALQIDPNIADTHYNLGTVLKRKGKLDKAITCYQKALQVNPEYIEAYYDLVDVIREEAEIENDPSVYKRSLNIIPDQAESYLHLGVVLEEKGLFEEAAICYEKTLNLNPNIEGAHGNYLCALFQIGESWPGKTGQRHKW
jgi:protein O-GlcNAc transferase